MTDQLLEDLTEAVGQEFVVTGPDIHPDLCHDECLTVAQWQDDPGGWVDRTSPYQCYDGVAQYLTPVSERGD